MDQNQQAALIAAFGQIGGDELCAQYVALRDKADGIAEQAKKQVAKITAILQLIEAEFNKRLTEAKVESARTTAGTYFFTTQTSVKVTDGVAYLDWVKKNERFDVLPASVNKTSAVEFMQEQARIAKELKEAGQELPPDFIAEIPGTQYTGRKVVQVRRASDKDKD